MSKIDDIALFVEVVKAGTLAAAGRQLGLSPAAMTARLKALEARYSTRLLNRNTRSLALTDAGQRFYLHGLRVVDEMNAAEAALKQDVAELSGTLKITATSDFGRQFVAPAVAEFCQLHTGVVVTLTLADSVLNLVAQGYDLAIRYGNLPDSSMVSRPLAPNRRLLCAAPDYLKRYGQPQVPEDLLQHRCLVMERGGEVLNDWYFSEAGARRAIKVAASMVSNDGALVRQWTLAGQGISVKSYWDVRQDLATGQLVEVLGGFTQGFESQDNDSVGLQAIYPSRQYLPRQVQAFIEFFQDYIQRFEQAV